jgi:hypothetical protein
MDRRAPPPLSARVRNAPPLRPPPRRSPRDLPSHRSDEALDARRLTAIFYLNPRWTEGDGGELTLWPWPAGAPIALPPLNDRLVLFSSTRMLHSVTPSSAERFCFTLWASAAPPAAGAPPPPRPSLAALAPAEGAGEAEQLRFLLHPAVRPHALKLLYAGPWADSLRASHPAGPALEAALAAHASDVALIGRALRRAAPAIDGFLGAPALDPALVAAAGGVAWFPPG